MYSLEYQLRIFYHTYTAYIIDSTYFSTHVQLRLYTPENLSQMYSLDYLLYIFYHQCTV
jgi:hypothetical protein